MADMNVSGRVQPGIHNLPSEVLGDIFVDLDEHALCFLATVNAPFQVEAERIIYRSVSFRRDDFARFQKFAASVNDATVSGSRRAAMTRKIVLPHGFALDNGNVSAAPHGSYVAERLNVLENVDYFEIRYEPSLRPYGVPVEIGAFTYNAFRLSILRLGISPTDHDLTFLQQQTGVRIFKADAEPPYFFRNVPGPPLFPQLHTAELGAMHWLPYLDGRQLRRLEVGECAYPAHRDMSWYRRISFTMPIVHLRCPLGLYKKNFEGFKHFVSILCPETLRSVNFGRLYVMDDDEDYHAWFPVFDWAVSCLQLNDLVMHLHLRDSRRPLPFEESRDEIEEGIKEHLKGLPGVPRTSIMVSNGSTTQARWVTLARTLDGDVEVEGIDLEDFDSSWKRWEV